MKNSTTQFMNSTPAKRSVMANDRLDYIGKRIHIMARELTILNGWLKIMIAQSNEMIDADQWDETKLDYSAAADTLTNAIVENSQLLKKYEHESKVALQRGNIHRTVQR